MLQTTEKYKIRSTKSKFKTMFAMNPNNTPKPERILSYFFQATQKDNEDMTKYSHLS